MRKEEVIARYQELVKELVEPAHNVVLSAGSASVMMGLRDETDDLDADVLPGVFKWACAVKKATVIVEENVNDRIKYSDKVDLHILDEDRGRVCIEGVWVYSPQELLNQKRYLMRMPNRRAEKMLRDQLEVSQLEELIRKPKFTAKAV
jgi:hypothetical protein